MPKKQQTFSKKIVPKNLEYSEENPSVGLSF